MLLTTEEQKKLAALSGCSGKFLERVLRSTSIVLFERDGRMFCRNEVSDELAPPGRERKLELGLCLEQVGASKSIDRQRLITLVADGVKQYARTCPAVALWLGRGDFNPRKIPDQLTVAFILHANRTAGRLRAAILRALGPAR